MRGAVQKKEAVTSESNLTNAFKMSADVLEFTAYLVFVIASARTVALTPKKYRETATAGAPPRPSFSPPAGGHAISHPSLIEGLRVLVGTARRAEIDREAFPSTGMRARGLVTAARVLAGCRQQVTTASGGWLGIAGALRLDPPTTATGCSWSHDTKRYVSRWPFPKSGGVEGFPDQYMQSIKKRVVPTRSHEGTSNEVSRGGGARAPRTSKWGTLFLQIIVVYFEANAPA